MKNGSPKRSVFVFAVLIAALTAVLVSCGSSGSITESAEETIILSTGVDPVSDAVDTGSLPGPDETSSPDETSVKSETSESGNASASDTPDVTTVTGKSGGEASIVPSTTESDVETIPPSTGKTTETKFTSTDEPEVTVLPETEETAPEDFNGIVFRVTSDKKTVKRGDTLTLNVDLEQNPGFYVLVVGIEGAPGALKITSITANSAAKCAFFGDNRAVLDNKAYANSKYVGNILTFEYKITDTALPGKYKLKGYCDCATLEEQKLPSFFITPTIVITDD